MDMGEPVRIKDLAEQMIRLSGFEPGVDMQLVFSGVRPGEKLFEELAFGDESMVPTASPRMAILHDPLASAATTRIPRCPSVD